MAHNQSLMNGNGILGRVPDTWWETWHKAMLKALKTAALFPSLPKASPDIRSCGWLASPTGQRVCPSDDIFCLSVTLSSKGKARSIFITLWFVWALQEQRWILNVSCQMNKWLWKYKSKAIHVALGIAHLQNLICCYIDTFPRFIY